MWPRVGGHVGPPTPLTPEVDRFELMPRRSSTTPEEVGSGNALRHVVASRPSPHGSSSQPLGSSCVLSSCFLTLTPPITCPLPEYQQPLQMPLEPRSSPRRTYQRMYRRIQHPYRLSSLSERMHRYRPILPSLQEEEAPDQRSNISEETQARATKRQTPMASYQTSIQLEDHTNEVRILSEAPGNQRIPSHERRRPVRQSHWQQADEPEIVITSDVQLQTDDNETGFNSNNMSSLQDQSSSSDEQPEIAPHTNIIVTSQYIPGYNINIVDYDIVADEDPEETDESEEETELKGSYSSRPKEESGSANQTALNKSLKMLTLSSQVSGNWEQAALPALPTPTFKAKQVANSVIKHARNNKTLNEKALFCLSCNLFPVLPVTGPCGHTRCTRCIESSGECPCGALAPKDLHVNTVIQYLIGKMLPSVSAPSGSSCQERNSDSQDEKASTSPAVQLECSSERAVRARRSRRPGRWAARARVNGSDTYARMPMAPQVQFEYARRLVALGRYRDAAPHLARVAASSVPRARVARSILAQIIMLLEKNEDPRRVTRELYRSVRLQAAGSWLRPADLECVLCYHTYTRPVTTPCGHTYCRTCIERALDYRKACALCLRPLEDFDLTAVRETEFVSAALESIDASKPPLPPDPDVIPIFVCTVAYPSIPCPLFIFDPRYWLMIRRVLESGSRKFGMVAYERDRNYSDYGTVLEVCDCVHLEDGRSFLSTVGVSRFRVIERDVRDGCDVARIQPLTDITPTEEVVIFDIRCLGSQILYKSLMWLNAMNKSVRAEIENAFGEIPRFDDDGDGWWDSPDGPAWLWWLIAILPLRSEIKVLILSTKNLLKRMMAVSRTLEAIDQVSITTTATSECEIRSALTNAEEWLERGS